MKNICSHLERRSRFLQALVPINPCEEIRFGMTDCLGIAGFLCGLAGLAFLLAK